MIYTDMHSFSYQTTLENIKILMAWDGSKHGQDGSRCPISTDLDFYLNG